MRMCFLNLEVLDNLNVIWLGDWIIVLHVLQYLNLHLSLSVESFLVPNDLYRHLRFGFVVEDLQTCPKDPFPGRILVFRSDRRCGRPGVSLKSLRSSWRSVVLLVDVPAEIGGS